MIPAAPGIYAHFRDEHARPVVAFNADGEALVPTEAGGLEIASEGYGFQFLDWLHHTAATQLVPGGGYVASWPDGSTRPVIAWAACHDGVVRALVAEEVHPTAWSCDYGEVNAFTVSHPDETGPGGSRR